jgi:hypothetical protein
MLDLLPQFLFVRVIDRGIWGRGRWCFLHPSDFRELKPWNPEIEDFVDGSEREGNSM